MFDRVSLGCVGTVADIGTADAQEAKHREKRFTNYTVSVMSLRFSIKRLAVSLMMLRHYCKGT